MRVYTLEELVREADVTVRTVRYYVARRALPGPVLRGMRTTYTDEHLERLRAIRHLRLHERLRLDAIIKRLAGLSPAEIRAVCPRPPGEPAPPAPPPVASAGLSLPGERWDRIVLLPGLELHLRADASALLQRLAQEIHRQYGASA